MKRMHGTANVINKDANIKTILIYITSFSLINILR